MDSPRIGTDSDRYPPPQLIAGEELFMHADGVTVTNLRFKINHMEWPLELLERVEVKIHHFHGTRATGCIGILIGLALSGFGLLLFLEGQVYTFPSSVIGLGGLLIAGYLGRNFTKPTRYQFRIYLANRRPEFLETEDPELVEALVNGLRSVGCDVSRK